MKIELEIDRERERERERTTRNKENCQRDRHISFRGTDRKFYAS